MDRDEAVKKFKRKYTDPDITCKVLEQVKDDVFLLIGDFPDSEYYFYVTEDVVSSAFMNKDDALRRIRSI
jgi:hypothetical protein